MYSNPATYASEGNTGYKSTFAMGSPPTAIAEIKTINNKPVSSPEVDFSHLLSPANTRELKPGMIKPGQIKLGMNFIGDTTQKQFLTLTQGQTEIWGQISAPMQGGSQTYTGNGYMWVADISEGSWELDKPIELEVTMQLAGEWFETIG